MKEERKNLLKIAKKIRKFVITYYGRPDCQCGIASYLIAKILEKESIDYSICENEEHSFIKSGQYFIDVTADQFGEFPEIVIRKKLPKKTFWEIENIYKRRSDFTRFQRKTWPDTEIAANDKKMLKEFNIYYETDNHSRMS